jgi:ribosomal protein L20A (L18A)
LEGDRRGKKEKKGEKDKATATTITIKTKRIAKTILSIYRSSRKRVRTTTREIKVDLVYSSPPPIKRVKRASLTVISIENISRGLERLLKRTAT